MVYSRHRVLSYWLVDPETPALTVLELDSAGDYRPVADVVGSETFLALRPFAVRLCPLDLVAGMRPC